MSEALLLGIDVGTTRTKVGAFRPDGRAAAMCTAEYAQRLKAEGDAAEQEPQEWWGSVGNAVQRTLAQIDPKGLLAVCVGGQGPTMVAVDAGLIPVAPALTWLDRRGAPYATALGGRIKRFIPSHSFLAKAMWFEQERAAAYARTRWFCQAWDYIAMQLTGNAAVSTSDGVAPWDEEQVGASGLDAGKFPRLQRMGEVLGTVTPEAARFTGLPQGLPVIGGITDYFGGILGSGAVCKGVACDSGGTSQSLNVCWDAKLAVEGIFCMPSFEQGHWYIGGPASTTGRALEWWREDILHAAPNDWTMVQAAGEVEPGGGRLLFLPYLAGERAPLWNNDARGMFFGLSLEHTQAHMTRAILEGVAFSMRHILEHIERAGATIQEIHCCGGQATSEAWCQIKADVMGKPVMVPEVTEAAVLGAAVIAGVGAGVFENLAEGATKMVRPRVQLEPNVERHAQYKESYALYRDLYESVKPLYARLKPA